MLVLEPLQKIYFDDSGLQVAEVCIRLFRSHILLLFKKTTNHLQVVVSGTGCAVALSTEIEEGEVLQQLGHDYLQGVRNTFFNLRAHSTRFFILLFTFNKFF
jgi:hypothetical protein